MKQVLDARLLERAPFDLEGEARIFVMAHVGSMSHGTHLPAHEKVDDPGAIDDVDVLGAVIPPARFLVGLDEWQHWTLQYEELDVTLYSLAKLVRLWLKSNPNVLGLLWLRPEHYLIRSEGFDRFLEIRDAFSSRQIYRSFTGYAVAQLRDVHRNVYQGYMGTKRRVLVEQFGYDIKHAAHAIRVLRMGTEFLRDGQLRVYREHDGDDIRAIKRGEWSLSAVQAHAEDLFAEAETLVAISDLPEHPDRERVAGVLIDITRDWLCAA